MCAPKCHSRKKRVNCVLAMARNFGTLEGFNCNKSTDSPTACEKVGEREVIVNSRIPRLSDKLANRFSIRGMPARSRMRERFVR